MSVHFGPTGDLWMSCLHEIEQESIQIAQFLAEELDDDIPDLKGPGNSFELARILKGKGGEVSDYYESIRAYCETRGFSVESFWETFVYLWESVKFPNFGVNGLEWAFEQAIREPIPLRIKSNLKVREIVYSMCWHLAVRNHPQPFMLAPTSRQTFGS
jgi:hypothetical protein